MAGGAALLFKVLLAGELKELANVQKLAESDATKDLLLAAAAYEGYGVYDEALQVFEQLARLQPTVARYQRALAQHYRHAGWPDQPEEALKKANELRTPRDRIPPAQMP